MNFELIMTDTSIKRRYGLLIRSMNSSKNCTGGNETKHQYTSRLFEYRSYLDVIFRPKLDKKEVVADFGCGQAKLARSVSTDRYKVFSFDFVAVNDHVTACDMSNTKLFNNSVDIAIFCLSLMGSNISQYIREANRVLRDG